ncbi:MAG: hypothetical protein ACD_9C00300G0003, partial [uncultured bacterium]
MYYTYAISSLNRKYIYVGISDNTDRRITSHNKGYNKTTKAYCPFKTILIEEYCTRMEAREREKYLKTGFGKRVFKVAGLINAQVVELVYTPV